MQRKLPQIATTVLAGALALATAAPLVAQTTTAVTSPDMPKVGDMAPDFKLHYFADNQLKELSLSDYRGKKNVVLAFFVFAFTGG